MFTGVIEGVGPRYCPSVEDKVVRFADKVSHSSSLARRPRHEWIYPNGISTSLPFDVQCEFVRTIRARTRSHHAARLRDRVRLLRSRDLKPTLETQHVARLFFADRSMARPATGAAAQDSLRGQCRAAAREREPWWPKAARRHRRADRRPITRGAPEPYRMFTSRAEYRHAARGQRRPAVDTGRSRAGIVDDARWRLFERARRGRCGSGGSSQRDSPWHRDRGPCRAVARCTAHARTARIRPLAKTRGRLRRADGADRRAAGRLADDERLAAQVPLQVDVQAKYSGYIERQTDEIERQRRHEETTLPAEIDYARPRAVARGAPAAPRASPGDDRHRVKDSGHHARGDLAVADPPEAPRPGAAGERHGPRGRRGSLSTSNVLVRAFLRTLPASNTRPFITR